MLSDIVHVSSGSFRADKRRTFERRNMPLIERRVPSYIDLAPSTPLDVSDPRSQLQHVHIGNMTGVLKQLQIVTDYAAQIFEGLIEASKDTHDKINRIGARVDKMNHDLEVYDAALVANDPSKVQYMLKAEPHKAICDRQTDYCSANRSNSKAVQALYEASAPPPNFSSLDEFTPEDHEPCIKKYSNPMLFVEEWMKAEELRQQKARKEQRHRRQLRKAKRAARASLKQPLDTSAEEKKKLQGVKDWRDIYGTGEGRELRECVVVVDDVEKEPIVPEEPQEDEEVPPPPPEEELIKEGARITSEPPEIEEIPPPPPPPEDFPLDISAPPAVPATRTEPLPAAPKLPTVSPPKKPSPAPSEPIASERRSSAPKGLLAQIQKGKTLRRTETKLPASVKPQVSTPEAPPPVLPSPIKNIEVKESGPSRVSLLSQIQQGKKLRSVKQRENTTAPKREPEMSALLSQIRQKMTLRHVEPQERKAAPAPQSTSFAGTIAEILARRAAIAFESDSEGEDSDSDWS